MFSWQTISYVEEVSNCLLISSSGAYTVLRLIIMSLIEVHIEKWYLCETTLCLRNIPIKLIGLMLSNVFDHVNVLIIFTVANCLVRVMAFAQPIVFDSTQLSYQGVGFSMM